MANHSITVAKLSTDVPAKAASLSERTDRDRSAIIAQIEEGLAASRAGRVVGHDTVMRKARNLIEGGRL